MSSKRSRSQKKREKSNSNKKYLTKTIKLETPYLADGIITKKYLNAQYLKQVAAVFEAKRVAKLSEDYQPVYKKPTSSPYEAALSTSPRRNPYPNVKSKYLAEPPSLLASKTAQTVYVVAAASPARRRRRQQPPDRPPRPGQEELVEVFQGDLQADQLLLADEPQGLQLLHPQRQLQRPHQEPQPVRALRTDRQQR
jgi:hypothetical protein